MNDQESSSDRPESSTSGEGQQSSGSNDGGSSDSFQANDNMNAGPGQQVPRYVDMVIPDYDEPAKMPAVNNREHSNNDEAPENHHHRHHRRHHAARLPDEAHGNGPAFAQAQREPEYHPEDPVREEDEQEESSSEEDSLAGDSRDNLYDDDASPQQPCIPNENDVLLDVGKDHGGGDHQGNLRYRAVVRHLSKKYAKVKVGYRRAAVQILVNAVKVQGGRFLQRTPEGLWKEVSNKKAYHKSSHAIRGTCRKVEIVSSSRKRKSRSSRRRSDSRKNLKHAQAQQQQQTQQQSSNSETTSQSTDEVPLNEPRGNLEIMALRLQTKDASLRFLSLDLHTVDHDIIFPFAKALDSSDLLSSLQLRLSHMNRTNANALAWGLKRCKGLQQVKLDYKNLSEKSSIVLAGLLDNPFLESLNLDENEMTADSLKFLSRMINQSKECKLKRLSLQNNPLGDEGAGILAKLITSSRHLRFLNLGGNGIQAAGVSLIRAAINKKNSYLFEVSGLEMVNFNRKRAIGESTEDSTEDQGANKKLRAVPSTSGNPAASQVVSSSQPSSSFGSIRNQSSSNTSSSNETEMAPNSTGSDNGINNAGSDDAPTSSMNDSDDSPSTQSN